MILDAHGHVRPVYAFWLPVLFALGVSVIDHLLRGPATSMWLYAENGLNETIQYLIAFAGVYVGVSAFRLARSKWLRIWTALASLGLLYIGLEEISYGQQFFNWNTPEFWGQINDQNETNLHNTSSWYDQKPRLVLMVGIIVGGLILPVIQKTRPALLPARFRIVYPKADLKWVALLTLLSYLTKTLYKITGFTVYDRPSEINETYIYLFMLLYLLQLRWTLRQGAASA